VGLQEVGYDQTHTASNVRGNEAGNIKEKRRKIADFLAKKALLQPGLRQSKCDLLVHLSCILNICRKWKDPGLKSDSLGLPGAD